MTTTVTTSTSIDIVSVVFLSYGRAARSGSRTSSGSGAGTMPAASASNSTTSVELSDQAEALLQKLADTQAAALRLPDSFDEMVVQKTSALAARLIKDFAHDNIPVDEAIAFTIDSSGTVHADGPYKKRIEQYLKDNPDVAKEFQTVATLNALRATEQALRLYLKETQAATTDKDKAAASDRYVVRSMSIQSLAGHLTLADGQLSSAAMEYVTALSPPRTQAA